ncbi:hypothetical protein [Bacillus phage YungSlug]|nr:hypothetical protein [Bacillus phage YungSlug]
MRSCQNCETGKPKLFQKICEACKDDIKYGMDDKVCTRCKVVFGKIGHNQGYKPYCSDCSKILTDRRIRAWERRKEEEIIAYKQKDALSNIKLIQELLATDGLTIRNNENLNSRLDGYIVEYFNLEVKKAELRDEVEKESEEDKNAVKQSNS